MGHFGWARMNSYICIVPVQEIEELELWQVIYFFRRRLSSKRQTPTGVLFDALQCLLTEQSASCRVIVFLLFI